MGSEKKKKKHVHMYKTDPHLQIGKNKLGPEQNLQNKWTERYALQA